MRGPVISQQRIGEQTSSELEETNRDVTKDSGLDQKNEGKCAKVKRSCQQRSCVRVAAVPCIAPCSSLDTTKNATQLTFEQAKAFVKARKRKERQESVTSICQDRKVIRSNSEERPTNSKNNIRRVSSHEDFKKTSKDELAPWQVHFQRKDNLMELECEFERRRCHERFSRPLSQRYKYNSQGRRPKSKHFGKKDKSKRTNKLETEHHDAACNSSTDIEIPTNIHQTHYTENERSPSPICASISPALDLSTLHEQIDGTEPLPSTVIRKVSEENETLSSLSMTSSRILSSPRNSVIITQRIYLNPDIPQTICDISNEIKKPLEHRQKQVAKQISNVKDKIKKSDEEFLTNFGYRPSHADKLINKNMKRLCDELHRLKKEHSQFEHSSTNEGHFNIGEERTGPILRNTLQEIEKKLDSKRLFAKRSKEIDEMTNEQLVQEKVAVQKALLYLESQHGRPTLKEDKDLVRPLYDRYRLLKRLVAKLNMANNIIELATIHEHETMDFAAIPPTISINTDHVGVSEKARPSHVQTLASSSFTTSSTTDSSDTDTSIGENLHSLTLEELYEQQKNACEKKKQIRRTLKEFEVEFEEKAGRRVQREDKMIMEEVYKSYKNTKAKLKLLDALVGKQFGEAK